VLIRYSRWDGTQRLTEPDADDLLAAMADDLLTDGDLASALRRLLQQGARDPRGQGLPGLQDLLRQLRQRRQRELDRYDLGSALEDIERSSPEVVQTERQGIERRLAGEEAAARLEALDGSPGPGRAAPRAPALRLRRAGGAPLFEELLRSLRQQMLQPLLAGMRQALEGMTPADRSRCGRCWQELNRMLRERAAGGEPDFEAFRARWGEQFPASRASTSSSPTSLARSRRWSRSSRAGSPAQRGQLEAMMQSLLLQDERLDAALRQLAPSLRRWRPSRAYLSHNMLARSDSICAIWRARWAMKLVEALDAGELLAPPGPGRPRSRAPPPPRAPRSIRFSSCSISRICCRSAGSFPRGPAACRPGAAGASADGATGVTPRRGGRASGSTKS